MSELCLGCMNENQGEDICPRCQFPKNAVQASPYLPLGTVLKRRYIVGKVLDNRADSTRYIGYDQETKATVKIREFMPKGMFTRLEDSTVITVLQDKEKEFAQLHEKYLTLTRQVANFKNSAAIFPIYDIFQDNNTSYTVSVVEEVIPFAEYIKRSGGSLEWDVARPLFMPLLSALSTFNSKGLYHFAICPANLVVTPAGKVKIINFAINDIRQTGKQLPPQLFSGCSAPEQYESQAVLDESTDVYGFTATLFFALTGNLPADAIKRKEDSRLLMSTSVVKKLPPHVVSALAGGLQIEKSNRIADFETLRAQLSAAPTVQAIQEEIAKPAVLPPADTTATQDKQKGSNFKVGVIAMLIGLIVFSVAGYFWYSQNPLDDLFKPNEDGTSAVEASDPLQPGDLTYPADSEYFRVPSFIGKTVEQAKAEANAASNTQSSGAKEFYVVETIDETKVFSDTVPEGQICKQIPDANMTVSRGNDGVTISVTVSKGKQYRELPKVINTKKEAAAAALKKEGFIVNSTLDYSETIPEGTVISYVGNTKEGDKLEYGTTVTICVSLGVKPSEPEEKLFLYRDETR